MMGVFEAELWPCQGRVLRFALRLTGNAADAEDLTQRVMIQAWRKQDQYTPGTNPDGWLMTIARHMWASTVSRVKRAGWETFPAAWAHYRELLHEERAEALAPMGRCTPLWEAVAETVEKYGDVLVPFYVEDYTSKELGEALGVPQGTVMSQLYRCRVMAREKLAPLRAAGAL